MRFYQKTALVVTIAACAVCMDGQTAVPSIGASAATACKPFPPSIRYPENFLPVMLTGDVNGDGIPDLVAVSHDGVRILIGKGNGRFTAGATYSTGGVDFNGGAAIGDFNHDGKLDLAVATSPAQGTAATVNVFLGNGDGTFQAPHKSPIQVGTTFLAAGDFNQDGNPDLAGVSTIQANSTVQVLLGKGDGTFQSPVNYQAGATPSGIAIADFNGDSKLDLAVANSGSQTMSVLLGKGDGTFNAQTPFPVGGAAPFGITAADFNGDGKMDVATANNASGTTSVLLGNGDGTFGTAMTYPTGGLFAPYSVSAIQFEKGGKPGLVVGTTSGIFTLANQGGIFGAGPGYNPPTTTGVVVADFNGDGKADLAFGSGQYNIDAGVTVLLGTGHGAFATTTAYLGVPNMVAIATGDFNGDGIPDLAVGDLNSPYYLGIMLGDGKRGFTAPVHLYTMVSSPWGIAAGDLNGDGKLDLALALDNGTVQILLGNGDGSFNMGANYNLYKSSPPTYGFIALADFNGDGTPDIAVTSPGVFSAPGVVSILLGNGDGTYQSAVGYAVEATTNTVAQDVLEGIAVADFNADGKLDFAVGDNLTGMLRIFLGNGDGTFSAGPQTPVQTFVNSLAVADFNGDHKLDLAVGVSNVIQILLGNGDGSFRPGVNLNAPGGSVIAADFNRDGRADLISGLNGDELQLFPGKGDGTFGSAIPTYTSLAPSQFAMADLNGDGSPDVVTAGVSVSVLLNRCGGK